MPRRIVFPSSRQWQHEFSEAIQGACGGFLFGIPLLYTMEVWWIGSYIEPEIMLLILAVTFVIVFALNRTDGFRQIRPDDSIHAAMDSVEAIAIGVFCVTCVLVLLQEVTLDNSLDEALGKIVLEGVPFAIGVALARSLLREDEPNGNNQETAAEGNLGDKQMAASRTANSDQSSEATSRRPNSKSVKYNATLADIGATLIGTVIIAFNVAPTDEIPMLVAAASAPWLVGLILASLIISYCIVFVAGFRTQQKRRQQQGIFQRPLTETLISYCISLGAAMFMLWFFHKLTFADPWMLWMRYTIVLGLPASVGGAAGRLAV